MKGKVLAIDYGTRRVGLAVSDRDRRIALPYRTLHVDKNLITTLKEIVEREEVVEVVVGLPLGLRGQETPRTQEVRAFVSLLERALPCPIHLIDERLTSLEAERRLREAGTRPSRNKGRIDQVAAMLILESFLERVR